MEKGKEDDAIIRLLCALLEKGFINLEKISLTTPFSGPVKPPAAEFDR